MAEPGDTEPSWTFVRGNDRIVLRCPSRSRIVISGSAARVRRIDFEEPGARIAYQSGFERHLINTGWTLVDFTPGESPRRVSRVRRLLSRLGRRRLPRRADENAPET
jgi:hypothetical protein